MIDYFLLRQQMITIICHECELMDSHVFLFYFNLGMESIYINYSKDRENINIETVGKNAEY
jgi:hypothetical protein